MVKGVNLMLCGSRYPGLLSSDKFCILPVWHLQGNSATLRAFQGPFTVELPSSAAEGRKAILLLGKGQRGGFNTYLESDGG